MLELSRFFTYVQIALTYAINSFLNGQPIGIYNVWIDFYLLTDTLSETDF